MSAVQLSVISGGKKQFDNRVHIPRKEFYKSLDIIGYRYRQVMEINRLLTEALNKPHDLKLKQGNMLPKDRAFFHRAINTMVGDIGEEYQKLFDTLYK